MSDIENQTPAPSHPTRPQFLLALMALFFPPLPVFLLTGPNYTIWTKEVLLSILLTIFGHLPGFLFSLYLIFKAPSVEGYTNLEEESLLHPHHNSHGAHSHTHAAQEPNGEPSSAQKTPDAPVVVAPYTDHPSEEPPTYQDIATSSDSAVKAAADTKDTKVQK